MAVKELLVEAVIEIPKGAQNKYEFDSARGVFRLDRVLYSPVHFPADYGFIPETLAEDGDPLDILVLVSMPTFPGCLVPARVIGALTMEDDKGVDTGCLRLSHVSFDCCPFSRIVGLYRHVWHPVGSPGVFVEPGIVKGQYQPFFLLGIA